MKKTFNWYINTDTFRNKIRLANFRRKIGTIVISFQRFIIKGNSPGTLRRDAAQMRCIIRTTNAILPCTLRTWVCQCAWTYTMRMPIYSNGKLLGSRSNAPDPTQTLALAFALALPAALGLVLALPLAVAFVFAAAAIFDK